MAAFKLAIKNLYRNAKYTAGLFAVFLVAAVMCVSFLLFSGMSQAAYSGILARQASTSFVSLSFTSLTFFNEDGTTTTSKGDISADNLAAVRAIDGVRNVYKFNYDYSLCSVSLDGGDDMEMGLYPLLFEGGSIPEPFVTEFNALYGEELLVCGGLISGANTCLVSEAFVKQVGADSADDLLGKTLATFIDTYAIYGEQGNAEVEIIQTEYLEEMTICGVVNGKFAGISFMEDYGENFIIAGIGSNVYQSSFANCYLIYGDYADLDGIKTAVDALDITGGRTVSGNESYAMRKLSQMSQFISAILVLIAVVCLCACIAVVAGVAMLKFARNKPFYHAAFSVGLSENSLALSFLYEFLMVALAAFAVSLPLGALLVNGLAAILTLYLGVELAVQLSFSAALYSLIPLAGAGLISAAIVRVRLAVAK